MGGTRSNYLENECFSSVVLKFNTCRNHPEGLCIRYLMMWGKLPQNLATGKNNKHLLSCTVSVVSLVGTDWLACSPWYLSWGCIWAVWIWLADLFSRQFTKKMAVSWRPQFLTTPLYRCAWMPHSMAAGFPTAGNPRERARRRPQYFLWCHKLCITLVTFYLLYKSVPLLWDGTTQRQGYQVGITGGHTGGWLPHLSKTQTSGMTPRVSGKRGRGKNLHF